MKEALETSRLLAWKTEGITEVILDLAKEGKLIELAALLMVAREKVLSPMTFDSEDDSTSKRTMTLLQCINNELAALVDQEYSLMGRKEEKQLFQLCKEKKLVMMHTMQLLEIFERAGGAIEGYLQSIQADAPNHQVAHDLARLLSEAGFSLRSEDTDLSDIIDSRSTIPTNALWKVLDDPVQEQKEQSEESTECGVQWCDSQMSHSSQSGGFLVKGKPIGGMPNELQRFVRTSFPGRPPVLSSPVQKFHAFWIPKASFSLGCLKAGELQVKDRTRVIEQSVWKFPASKQLASFMLAVKRGVRRM